MSNYYQINCNHQQIIISKQSIYFTFEFINCIIYQIVWRALMFLVQFLLWCKVTLLSRMFQPTMLPPVIKGVCDIESSVSKALIKCLFYCKVQFNAVEHKANSLKSSNWLFSTILIKTVPLLIFCSLSPPHTSIISAN